MKSSNPYSLENLKKFGLEDLKQLKTTKKSVSFIIENKKFKNKKFKSGDYNKKIYFYSYLLAWGCLVYEFIQNRMLSSRVNELQGKVDNLYQKINENKKDNEVLNGK